MYVDLQQFAAILLPHRREALGVGRLSRRINNYDTDSIGRQQIEKKLFF